MIPGLSGSGLLKVENYVVTINRSSRTFLHFIYVCAEDVTDKWLYLEFTSKNRVDIYFFKLVEAISETGLEDGLQKFYDKPLEKETKSIVAGPKLCNSYVIYFSSFSSSDYWRRHYTV